LRTSTPSSAAAASHASPRAQRKAAQPVGTLAAGGFRDAKVRAEKRAAVLVLYGGIATRKSARECVAKAQSFAGDLEGVQSLVVESRKRG